MKTKFTKQNSEETNYLTFRGIITDVKDLDNIKDLKPGYYFYLLNSLSMYMCDGKNFEEVKLDGLFN